MCSDFPNFNIDIIREFTKNVFPSNTYPLVINLQSGHVKKGRKENKTSFLLVATKQFSKDLHDCFKSLPKANSPPASTLTDMRDSFDNDDRLSPIIKKNPFYRNSDAPLLIHQKIIENENWTSILHMTTDKSWFSCKHVLQFLFGLPDDYCE